MIPTFLKPNLHVLKIRQINVNLHFQGVLIIPRPSDGSLCYVMSVRIIPIDYNYMSFRTAPGAIFINSDIVLNIIDLII